MPTRLIGAAVAYLALGLPAHGSCDLPEHSCQEPDIAQFPGGTILTATPTYDNFRSGATALDKVCFYGAYIDVAGSVDCDDAPNLQDQVVVFIYQSDPGLPPTLGELPVAALFTLDSDAPGVNSTIVRRATGFEFNLAGFAAPVTEYEWTLDRTTPGALVNGNCYWMYIQNDMTSDVTNCAWYWEVSPERTLDPVGGDGDGRSLDRDLLLACVNAGGVPTVCASQTDNAFDMAWCLDFDLGDPADTSDPGTTGCYLPIDAGCTEITCTIDDDCPPGVLCADGLCDRGDCNVPNGTAGCSDPECCTLVCTPAEMGGAGLAVCCTTPWSQLCADAAIGFGCTPVPPCQPQENCQFVAEADAFNSTTATNAAYDQFTSADDFTPLADGSVNSICWYGVYQYADPANPNPDLFRVRYFEDDDGRPGAVLATFTQGVNLTYDPDDPAHRKDSNLDLIGDPNLPIIVYSAQHADVPVEGGRCYWIEISNRIGDPDADDAASSWFWSFAQTSATPPLYSGNGRMALDEHPLGYYDYVEVVAAADLAFCVGVEVTNPACGLQTLFNTGPEHPVFDTSAGSSTFLGWSSGALCLDCDGASVPCGPADAFPQRRTAQAFHLGPVGPGGVSHRIRYIYASGFPVDLTFFQVLRYAVFSRSGLERPDEDDILVEGSMPFSAIIPMDNPEGGFGPKELYYLNVDFTLPGDADYWLSVWAHNNQMEPANWVWFTNTHGGITNFCPEEGCVGPAPVCPGAQLTGCNPDDCAQTAGEPMMWRSAHFPDGAPGDPSPGDGFGFGSFRAPAFSYSWDPVNDPGGSPQNLYKTSFQIRGTIETCGNGVIDPGEECDPPGGFCNPDCRLQRPECFWSCDASGDNDANVADLLALLGQYDPLAPAVCDGGSCDYDGNGCVDVSDLLKLLAHFTTDPSGAGCP